MKLSENIGVVPQENLLYKTLSCAENLRFFAKIYGLRGKNCNKRMDYCLEAVELGDRLYSQQSSYRDDKR
ncbi:hypothetical protein [[Leptolyngbya] sp. PCC 7376]|uniref:hypothetical protein n=1 Tax=[Leptolyngbya] sp. PCC 7376 TaxID=111781 RepID=UPI0002EDEC70